MRSQRTLGVIGHVDHGKTALVRALTGVETDRLREERERGLSIVLGFAHLELDECIIDFIDVPGHEDFVRMMISGATGIDGVILVVAANESVMPQTREHFEIARLLGIDSGVIVMTKCDLVAEETLAVTEQNVRELVTGSFLQDAPLLRVSTLNGDGVDELKAELPSLFEPKAIGDAVDVAFLPIDRVFAMSGFGIVVTGTLRHGSLKEKQAVELLPRGRKATVRALQNHNETVETAFAGQRVAVNLRGVEREEVDRGDVLATEGFLKPSRRIDAQIELLSEQGNELKNGAEIRVLLGTSAIVARVRLLDKDALKPGDTGYVQLRCQSDVVTHRDERFILRSISPALTLGGGRVLVVNAERHRRFDEDVLEGLRRLTSTDSQAVFEARLADSGVAGVDVDALQRELSLSDDALAIAIEGVGAIRIDESLILDGSTYSTLLAEIVETLDGYHAAHPKQQGLSAAGLAHELEIEPDPKILRHAVAEVVGSGQIVMEGGVLHRPGFDPLSSLPAKEREIAAKLEQRFLADGLSPPDVDTVKKLAPGVQQLFQLLLETGALVRLKTYDRKSGMVLHRKVLAAVERKLEQQFPHPTTFTVAEVRDLLKVTRKSVVPLMEHLDSVGITVRDGNVRHMRKR